MTSIRTGRFLLYSTLLLAAGCHATVQHPEIMNVFRSQQTAWNSGDLDGFMQGYWQSDDLTFSSPEGEIRGWEAIRERYRTRYGNAQKMGRLTFDRLTVARTGDETAEASGTYRLDGLDQRRTGRFYLKLRRIDNRWVIVSDFTTPDS